MKRTMLIILSICALPAMAYTPPIGIPEPPSVLMDADVDNYIGQTYDFTLDGRGVQTYPISSVTGHPYTHYIDKDDPSATDTDNPYGTEATPRLTMPLDPTKYPDASSLYLAAGSILEIHGGPYDIGSSEERSLKCLGTAEKPVFIRGASGAIVGDFHFYLNGDYCIIEDLEFYKTHIWFAYVTGTVLNGPSYCCVRNCECHEDGDTPTGYNAISLDGSIINDPYEEKVVHHIIVYNNNLHHYGKWDHIEENDAHGVSVIDYSEYIWVLENQIHHFGGDSLQLGNQSERKSSHIYIGGNNMYSNRENAVDCKQARDVIVAHNLIHTFGFNTSREPGMVVHTGTLGTTCPDNIWIIFNKIYDCDNKGIDIYGPATDVHIIGNLFYDIPTQAIDGVNPFAIGISRVLGGDTHYIINNTFYNCAAGIWKNTDADEHTDLHICNNIIDSLKYGTGTTMRKHILFEATASDTKIVTDYNLYYESGGTEAIRFGATVYSLSEYVAATTNGDHSVAGQSPAFTNPGSNFSLQAGSPAEGTGLWGGNVSAAYGRFETAFGFAIEYDIANNPLASPPNMGAYQGVDTSIKYLLFLKN